MRKNWYFNAIFFSFKVNKSKTIALIRHELIFLEPISVGDVDGSIVKLKFRQVNDGR